MENLAFLSYTHMLTVSGSFVCFYAAECQWFGDRFGEKQQDNHGDSFRERRLSSCLSAFPRHHYPVDNLKTVDSSYAFLRSDQSRVPVMPRGHLPVRVTSGVNLHRDGTKGYSGRNSVPRGIPPVGRATDGHMGHGGRDQPPAHFSRHAQVQHRPLDDEAMGRGKERKRGYYCSRMYEYNAPPTRN